MYKKVHDRQPSLPDVPQGYSTLGDLIVHDDYVEAFRSIGASSVDALFGLHADGSLDKAGLEAWRTRMRLTVEVGGAPVDLYVKRFEHPPSRARRERRRQCPQARTIAGIEWYWMRELARGGIRVPLPVALGEQVDGGQDIRSVVISRAVPGNSLELCAREWQKSGQPPDAGLPAELADLVRRFHALGVTHRDLYLSHVFFDAGGEPGARLHLIDLQRVFRPSWRFDRWRVKDLASLNYSVPSDLASPRARLRWFKRYAGKLQFDRADCRMIARIVAKTRRIARHDARQQQRLGKGSSA